MNEILPPVLDVCCGTKAMWFDKDDERALFLDNRKETLHKDTRPGRKPWVIAPDKVADFTNLPFPDESFKLVVFDPPHGRFGKTSYMAAFYGRLGDNWREMLRKGFLECFRVLKPEGILIFKWNEMQYPLSEILKLTDEKPLFGHKTGRATGTHWVAFMKHNNRMNPTPNSGRENWLFN
jgi:ubiquinone/menaquinone biosynthesis C-methylase UbiE